MKLHIRRGQDERRGFFGGSKGMSFALSARIELSAEERALVEKYKQWDVWVYLDKETERATPWTLKDMQESRTITRNGVEELLKAEGQLKNACGNLKALLSVMASFDGEEVVEF